MNIMTYIESIKTGFIEVISLITPALIIQTLLKIPKLPISNPIVTGNAFIISIIVVYLVYIFIVIVEIKEKVIESIKTPKKMLATALGWIIALFVILFVLAEVFKKLDIIPETILWILIVVVTNLILFFRERNRTKNRLAVQTTP